MEKMQLETKQEKKRDFLNADLTERMIRIEQKICSSFSKKKIKVEETEYYKSLSPTQREEYFAFIKNKKKKKSIFFMLLLAPLFIISFLKISLTGNVVVENGTIIFTNLELTIIALFILILFAGLVVLLERKLIERKLNKQVKLIHPILARKYMA
jgi:hypothetical protein